VFLFLYFINVLEVFLFFVCFLLVCAFVCLFIVHLVLFVLFVFLSLFSYCIATFNFPFSLFPISLVLFPCVCLPFFCLSFLVSSAATSEDTHSTHCDTTPEHLNMLFRACKTVPPPHIQILNTYTVPNHMSLSSLPFLLHTYIHTYNRSTPALIGPPHQQCSVSFPSWLLLPFSRLSCLLRPLKGNSLSAKPATTKTPRGLNTSRLAPVKVSPSRHEGRVGFKISKGCRWM